MNKIIAPIKSKPNQDPTVELLSVTAESVAETLQEALKKIKAPQEVKDLAESLYNLAAGIEYAAGGEADDELTQEFIQRVVVDAGRNVVKIGGVLYCPSGVTARRGGTLLAK